MMASPMKTSRRVGDMDTVRTVSRSIKSGENAFRTPEKRHSNPPKSPEKSTIGRKFAVTVMQPAFENVQFTSSSGLTIVTTPTEKVAC